jgi:S-adenosylmethionine decarboxylase
MSATFFEGPEKKLELVLADGQPFLRTFGDEAWERVVRACGAQILSKRSSDVFDAYLLSESSLFVYDQHVTLITCGRTRMVDAAEAILDMVGVEHVPLLILERKNEHFPWEQSTTFYDDARRLNALIPGRAVQFGDEHSHHVQLFHSAAPYLPERSDTTLEVLMHGLRDSAAPFLGGDLEAARSSGVCEIYPDFEIDDHVFQPAGYSLNALREQTYYTFHVTPEPLGSYVSFETNHDFRPDPLGAFQPVIEIFRPESFDLLAFDPQGSPLHVEVPGYQLLKHVTAELCGYAVSFLHFARPPQGPVPPLELPL